MAQIPGKKLCSLCEEKDGCIFCHQCKMALCKPCRKAHEKIQQTKSHSFSDLNQIDLSAYSSVEECNSHKDVYVLFCKECKSLICTKCITDNHKGHEFSQIKDIVKEFRTIAEKEILEIKDKLKSLSALITRIENVHIPELQEKTQKVKCDITSLTKEVESEIKTRKQIYISDVENREEIGKDELKAALSNHKRTYKNATDVCTRMESLLLEKCDITFYLAFKNLENNCYKCIGEPEGVEPPQVSSFNKESFLEDIVNDLEKKFDRRLSSLKRDLQQKDDIITGLVAEKDTLENRIEETQKSLLSCERNLQQKQDDIIKLVKEKDDLENNFTESQESLLRCEQNLQQKQDNITTLVEQKGDLENRIAESRKSLRSCERDLQQKQDTITLLERRKNDLENKIKESEKRQKSLEEEIHHKADIIRKLTAEKTDIQKSFLSSERDLQQKQDNITILVKEKDDLETKNKEYEKSILNLKRDLKEKQDSMNRFTKEKTTVEGIIEESKERQKSLQQEIHHKDEIIKNLTKENECLQERFFKIDTAYERFEENLQEKLGKPYSTENKSDQIVLQWRSEKTLLENESYQIMLKETLKGKWKRFIKDTCKQQKVTIEGLKADTSYQFKVRIVDDTTGNEGPFSEESEPIQTRPSPALDVLNSSEQIDVGPPKIYRLPIEENVSARNADAKTRKFVLGKEGNDPMERTLMIVGATGSGKSTLINGMANFIMGVRWEDPFRFTLINLETCEKEKETDQALSQTEWVTCYTLHNSVSDRVSYTVNLIDTPGFGDTRGLDQDKKIVEQIRHLFTAQGEKGVATLDAVCFILKAPDARLTTTQRYIFESILSLFGNDIKDNICTLITFADGQRPPVLAGVQALDGIPLPYDVYFTFNNSALFVDNTENSLSSFFWDMGIKSCHTFFNHLTKLQTKSLLPLTSEVLRKRQKLETTVLNLQQEIDVGLSKINVLEKEVEYFSRNAKAILANKNFEYEVDEDIQEKIDLTGKGQYTTNCLICNYTCHENCAFSNDKDKARCYSMNKEGNCTQCPKGCNWSEHHNTPYIIKWGKRRVKKRYDDMKRKYEEATQKTLTQEQVLEEMNQDIVIQEQGIQVMMEIISKLNNRLKEIALRPDPLSTVQYIDLMIASEEREKKSGFEGRIAALYKCKKRATYGESVQIFQDRVRNTRQTMQASEVADELLKDDKSLIGWFKNLFRSKPKK